MCRACMTTATITKEETHEMYGIDTGRVFRLGDTICIRVVDADKATKTVDFELVSEKGSLIRKLGGNQNGRVDKANCK